MATPFDIDVFDADVFDAAAASRPPKFSIDGVTSRMVASDQFSAPDVGGAGVTGRFKATFTTITSRLL